MTVLSERTRVNVGLFGVPLIFIAVVGFGITLGVKSAQMDQATKDVEEVQTAVVVSSAKAAQANEATADNVSKIVVTQAVQAEQIKQITDATAKKDEEQARMLQTILTAINRK